MVCCDMINTPLACRPWGYGATLDYQPKFDEFGERAGICLAIRGLRRIIRVSDFLRLQAFAFVAQRENPRSGLLQSIDAETVAVFRRQ